MSYDLAVIIVNYNVEYFLEQCLLSVRKAASLVNTQILVVDNNSVDGSVRLVKERFPEVTLIANRENTGFSFANNQAIRMADARYVLLLNPDTLVEEDTFEKMVRYLDAHPGVGALGVKMIDGKGNFLPESKRGLPTPRVAFYKIFGLAALFPRSKVFGGYHLGYLDKDKIHEVDVLSGAFMCIRREALDKAGLLDETFFMYGEDIDLSYRIKKAGYSNVYFPETRIIHYKGESTRKSSINYVLVFYRAMIIFANKHFSKENARTFSFLIQLAIYLRAGMAIVSRFLKGMFYPLLDGLLTFASLFQLARWYETHIKSTESGFFPQELYDYGLPAYVLLWLLALWINGGYDRPYNLSKSLGGVFYGTITALVLYALLPEHLRYSRVLIIAGALVFLGVHLLIRWIFSFIPLEYFKVFRKKDKNIAIAGGMEETRRVQEILTHAGMKDAKLFFVSPTGYPNGEKYFTGNFRNLKEIIQIHDIDEVVFCSKDISSEEIISRMSLLGSASLEFKIAPQESLFIIGSNSINSSGTWYSFEVNSINKPENRRKKKILDGVFSLLLLLSAPLWLFFSPNRKALFAGLWQVLLGRKSWVGYCPQREPSMQLPVISPGIFSVQDLRNGTFTEEEINNINVLYAKDYSLWKDIKAFYKNLLFSLMLLLLLKL
jgi:GT2 family glycosyltransferase